MTELLHKPTKEEQAKQEQERKKKLARASGFRATNHPDTPSFPPNGAMAYWDHAYDREKWY